MSSAEPPWTPPAGVDPRWAAPEPGYQRPHPAAYVFAVLLPLALLIVLAAPLGVVAALRWAGAAPPPAAPAPNTAGGPGLGDPYFPDYGSSGYDALTYTIALDFDPGRGELAGTTTITARATQQLDWLYYDLVLPTEAVSVGGAKARFEQTGSQDVKVTPATPIRAGATFELRVTYGGNPADYPTSRGQPWSVTNQEWTAAGEPESAAWWYPSNDHPSDPALMDVSVRVPAGLEVLSVGRLVSADARDEPGFDTWHWTAREPMATYLNFVSIGQYELQQGTENGRPYVYAVTEQLGVPERAKAFAALRRSGEVVRSLEKWFGPYPFSEIGGVVPAHRFSFGGLENQTRPVYAPAAILDDAFALELIAHELTHMWFGNQVTVRQWNDIFINEGYASWGQWAYGEKIGGRTLDNRFTRVYDALAGDRDFWRITMIDPGPDHLFDAVYQRGPMLLQALRNRIGDKAFFALARPWAQEPGSRSVEEWMIKAQSVTDQDLVPFFQAWVFGDTAPARTKENGFP